MKKRILSLIVAVAMVFTMMPAMTSTAWAAYEGKAGGVNYSFDSVTGVLTISKGTADGVYAAGEMKDFETYETYSKWGSGNAAKIKKVVIKEGVINVGKYAFYQLTALEGVEIASTVKIIDPYAFQNTTLTSIDLSEGLETIDGYAFWGAKLTEVTIPASVKVIEYNAFEDCTALATVKFAGEGLEKLGTGAFKECSVLANIEFPESVQQVKKDVLTDTLWIRNNTVNGNAVICGNTLIDENSAAPSLSEWTVPEDVLCIAEGALTDTRVDVLHTNDVKYISPGAATSNSSFSTVYFDNVEYIYGGFDKTDIATIYLNEGLKYIGESTFSLASWLKNIYLEADDSGYVFPESLEFIGRSAFNKTSFLSNAITNAYEGVVIIDDVLLTVTDDHAFGARFDVAENVSVMAEGTFESVGNSADNVTSIYISKSVKTLAELSYFKNLQTIEYEGNKTRWETINKLGDKSYFNDKNIIFLEVVEFPTNLVTGYTGTYDGKAHVPKVSTLPMGTTITWAYSKNGPYTATKPSKVNAGTYTVWYKLEADGYETYVDSVQIKINRKAITTTNTKVTLGATSYTYDGYAKKPAVTVKMGTTTLMLASKVDNKKIDLTYATGRIKPGTYKVTVKGIGNYTGSISKTFKISVQKRTIGSLVAGSKRFTAKWTSLSVRKASGYQIRYSVNSSMSNSKVVKAAGAAAKSKTVKNLKAKKKYYVQIRAYKTISGKTYYSAWSAKKAVTTKK